MQKTTLETEFVIEMHDDLIATYGGALGLRDMSLLSSALGQAELSRQFSEPSVHDLAATHGYHLCMDHPFVDGNKRTAAATMLVFLALHDLALVDPFAELVEDMVSIANKEIGKRELAELLQGNSWSTKPSGNNDLSTIYKDIKVYHGALFQKLAEV